MTGQAARLVLQFGGLVVLVRLLSPVDYGRLAMVSSIVGVGELLQDFGLSSAAIQSPTISSQQRDNLFWINAAIGLVLAVLVFVGASAIAAFFGEPEVRSIARALAPIFLLNGLSTQYRAHLNRSFALTRLSLISVIAPALGLGVAIVAACLSWGHWALVLQQLTQASATLLLLVWAARWLPGPPRRDAEMRHFLSFGGNLMAAQLLTYFSRSINSVLIGNRLGAELLGFYDRAFQLLMLPLNQINAPATTVALPILAKLQSDREKFAAFILRGQTVLVHLIVAVFAFSCAQADSLILLVLGEGWAPVIPLFRILALAGTFQAASYASYWVFLAKGLAQSQLRYALLSRSFLIGAIFVGMQWGMYGVTFAYSLGLGVMWPLGLLWIRRVSDAPARAMFHNGLRAMIGYAVCGGASYLASAALDSSSRPLLIAVGLAAMVTTFALVCAVWPAFRRDVLAIASTRSFLTAVRPG